MALPGRWWLQNLMLRHIYKIRFSFLKPFRLLLQSSEKVLIWSKKVFFAKMQYGYKKRRIYADFESVEKIYKNRAKEVINEKVKEKLSFWLFITVCKSCRPVTSFAWTVFVGNTVMATPLKMQLIDCWDTYMYNCKHSQIINDAWYFIL